jgi:simple sugar transport system permease protein
MVVGRGFIAVALVIFASWNPIRVMGGAYLFGAALALAPALQARGYGVNQFALDAIPFILTLLVLAVLGKRTLAAAPEELKRIFENAPAKT